tara:strand:- start:6596 stop:7075 length:480 start_codon:yes stop_codon:yes gene_type:complete
MNKDWFVATYKINEVKRVESNLLNQKFNYYLPKITIKKTNSNSKEEALFPGYIFINTSLKNYSALKYTMGIKNIIKFGDNIPLLSNEDIKAMEIAQHASKIDPIVSQMKIGQEAFVKKGSLKGNIVKIFSLPSRERAVVLFNLLGSMRRVAIPIKYLTS